MVHEGAVAATEHVREVGDLVGAGNTFWITSGTPVGIGIVPSPPIDCPPATGLSTALCDSLAAFFCAAWVSCSAWRTSASLRAPAATTASPAFEGVAAGAWWTLAGAG